MSIIQSLWGTGTNQEVCKNEINFAEWSREMHLGSYYYNADHPDPSVPWEKLGYEAYISYQNMWGSCDIFMGNNIFQPWCCNEAMQLGQWVE